MELFKGLGVAIITPMNEDLSIDYASFRKICQYLIDGNTQCIVVNGTTGESPTISKEELLQLVDIACEEVNGKNVKIIVGTGSNNTDHVIELCQLVEEKPIDGYLIVTPYYNKSTQKGLVEHFNYIANHVSKPIMLYDVPGRTNVRLSIESLLALAKHPNIFAVKDATSDLKHAMELSRKIKEEELDFYLYTGEDWNIFPYIAIGGSGVISVVGNLYPSATQTLCELSFSQNYEEARIQSNALSPIIDALFMDVNPINIKTAMAHKGFCKDIVRRPLIVTEEENRKKIIQAMNTFEKKGN